MVPRKKNISQDSGKEICFNEREKGSVCCGEKETAVAEVAKKKKRQWQQSRRKRQR